MLAEPPKKWVFWLGWIISLLPALMLLFSAGMKLFAHSPESDKYVEEHLGWPARYMTGLAILELCVTVIYLIPRTAVLGAILVVGYLGGATATHVRVAELPIIQVLLGMLAWLGLLLREPRLRPLLPIRVSRSDT
jgi:hypothetical protein